MLRRIIFFLFPALLVSCIPTPPPSGIPQECEVHLASPLRDLYSVPQTGITGKIPTHQYVRFQIYNRKEYEELNSRGILLLDHSFDVLPDKDLNYATENTNQYAVFYGVVPSGFNLSAYHAEKIRDLYMPVNQENARTSSVSKTFNGTVTFFDPIDSTMKPLKGVQVIIRDGTQTVSALTDPSGNFSIASSAIIRDTVEVLLKFDNDELEIHTLSLNDVLGVRGINIYSLGFRKACSFDDLQLKVDNSINSAALHHSCAMLLAFNEYKEFAAHAGFLFPDKKFLMWLGREAPLSTSYATPMLQNMSQQNISNPALLLENLFGIPPEIAASLANSLKDELPDVYAPFYNRYSKVARTSFIETLFHEFSHAAHFAKVGPDFWVPYVEYIYMNGGYGYDSLPNSGIISLSEAWAEDCSNIGLDYIYGKESYLTLNENTSSNWIPYGLYYDLYDDGTNESFDHVSGISFTDIYGLFTADTRSLATLKSKLESAYPDQRDAIDELFGFYGR